MFHIYNYCIYLCARKLWCICGVFLIWLNDEERITKVIRLVLLSFDFIIRLEEKRNKFFIVL